MSFRTLAVALGLTAAFFTAPSAQALSHAEDHAEVYIISPADGAEVKGPVTVVFGLKGMGIAPAGTDMANTGHHHLLIDTELPPLDENIPADENHIHFGGGQTQVTIDLAPGKHTLQLLLGDMNHIPHDPPVFSKKITITVTE